MAADLYYYYDWDLESPERFRRAVREFLDNGVRHFVLSCSMLSKMLAEPEFTAFVHKVCQEMDVSFAQAHGLFGPDADLNLPMPERRPGLFQEHIRSLEVAAEFGCQTFTLHTGACYYCHQHVPLDILHPLAVESLEKILPTAEKHGIVLAVENCFEMTNSVKEITRVVNHFGDHPNIGFCYDSGHANCMASGPGKDKAKYAPYFEVDWWESGVIWEDDAIEKMSDRIVTCHLHDNHGYGDLHGMPLDGTIDWQALVPKLKACPKMIAFQTEVVLNDGDNWAGHLLAPVGGYSIRRLVDTFRGLGF